MRHFFRKISALLAIAVVGVALASCTSEARPPANVNCTLDFDKTNFCKSILDYIDETALDEEAKKVCPSIVKPYSPDVQFALSQLSRISEIENDARAAKVWFETYAPKSEWDGVYNSQEEYVLTNLGDTHYLYGFADFDLVDKLASKNPEAQKLLDLNFLDFEPVTDSIAKNCSDEMSLVQDVDLKITNWNTSVVAAWETSKNVPWQPADFDALGDVAYQYADGYCSPNTSCFLINVIANKDCPTGVTAVGLSYDAKGTALGEHTANSPKFNMGKTARIEFKVVRNAARLEISSLTCN